MPRAVLLHGFLGSIADWADVLAVLDPRMQCECIALQSLGCESIAHAASRLAQRLQREPCDALIGYSMGGRIALELVANEPLLAPRLVLLSTSVGLANEHERTARAAQDDARAAQLLACGVDAFASSWYELPLFAPFREHASFADARARRACGDAAFWSACVAGCSPGRSACREHALALHAARTTYAFGALDERYAAFATHAARVAPGLAMHSIARAGHVLPLEAPHECARLIEQSLHSLPHTFA